MQQADQAEYTKGLKEFYSAQKYRTRLTCRGDGVLAAGFELRAPGPEGVGIRQGPEWASSVAVAPVSSTTGARDTLAVRKAVRRLVVYGCRLVPRTLVASCGGRGNAQNARIAHHVGTARHAFARSGNLAFLLVVRVLE